MVRPHAAKQAHLQGTQTRHTKLTLQKSLPYPTLLDTLQVIAISMWLDTPRRRANVQHGVWQNTG